MRRLEDLRNAAQTTILGDPSDPEDGETKLREVPFLYYCQIHGVTPRMALLKGADDAAARAVVAAIVAGADAGAYAGAPC